MSRPALLLVLAALVAVMWGLAFVSKRFEHVAAGVAALEARHFDTLTLVTAGTGGTFENPQRLGPALAVGLGDRVVLVDAGRGVAEALRGSEIPAWQPRTIFLTSLLPENTVGLDDLLTTGWLGPRNTPLRVYGPPGTAALVRGLRQAHQAGLRALGAEWELPEAGAAIEAVETALAEAVAIDGLSVRAVALQGGALPTRAYRFERAEAGGGPAIVVAGNGADAEALEAIGRGAQLLVTGAVYGASLEAAAAAGADRMEVLRREAAGHLRLEDLGALAARAGVATLVLVRLRPPPVFDFQYERLLGADFAGEVVVATDGSSIPAAGR